MNAFFMLALSLSLPIVALDAGHGGLQEGALGICGLPEKVLTLALAKQTAAILRESGQVGAFLTRTTDETLPLKIRGLRAQQARAAWLVSIHANASTNARAHGIETFFLSHQASNARSARLAQRENEGTSLSKQAHDPLENILQGMRLDANQNESQSLAFRIQNHLQQHLQIRGRGVLQAPFAVLADTHMPSVLVEVGFLTHPQECRRLASPTYQKQIAQALADGILEHLQRLHKNGALADYRASATST